MTDLNAKRESGSASLNDLKRLTIQHVQRLASCWNTQYPDHPIRTPDCVFQRSSEDDRLRGSIQRCRGHH